MSPALHVAFFNRAFHPEISATSQLLTELAEGLNRNHGCRVTVVCGVPQGATDGAWLRPPRRRLVSPDRMGEIAILRAAGTTWPKEIFLGRAANYLTYFLSACLAGLRMDPPDVVVALTDPPIIGLAALAAGRRFRCPLVLSFRDLFPEVSRLLSEARHPLVETALHRVNRILLRNAARIVALGEAMRRRLVEEKGAAPERVVIIPDWADTDALRPGPKRNPFSVAQGLADRFVVMHSGNMGASQNLEILVEAAARLKDLPDLVVAFIGEGVRKGALQAQAAGLGLANVRFLPYQPKEKLSESFASADCFVVSLKPGLAGCITPSKLYGILAAGRPYVAAVDEACDVARITREHRCGLLAEPGSPADLAAKIRLLHQDGRLREAMGAAARAAGERFSSRQGVAAYFDLLQEVVRTARESPL